MDIKEFFDEGLIYEGHKILPYCPRCGTGLASHEVAQGYKMVKTNTLTVKFRKAGTENEYFLAWTTTPWTLASNTALTSVIRQGLKAAGLPENSVNIIENTDRALVKELLTLRGFIDLAIPRGGAGLIRMVVDTATVPCIETGSGVCHVYVDKDADLSMAVKIVENAKVSRPSTCNAMETLLVHRDVAKDFLETLAPVMKDDAVELRGDDEARAVSAMKAADDEDWATEYNSLIMSVKVVDSLDEALDHIRRFSTHHSEAIVTNNKETAEAFQKSVDSAAVYVNASTRFTDGFEFGFGAEIGISTQKLHVRGPMGLEALVSYKYLIDGQGQIR